MANKIVVIKEYDELIARNPTPESFRNADKGPDFCPATFWAYWNSQLNCQSLLDFSGTICDKDIKAITGSLRKLGIKEFTISSTACGIIKTLALFEAEGAKVQGLTSVKGLEGDIPAVLIRIA